MGWFATQIKLNLDYWLIRRADDQANKDFKNGFFWIGR